MAAFFIFTLASLAAAEEFESLLDKELSQFEVWMGVPHASVEGLPEGTFQTDDVHDGVPMGLGNDVKQVFRVIEEAGVPVLRVSGEIYGGLTTLKSYENYHLRMLFKWGDRKWEPRLDQLRDSGLLYHCHGEHGVFWKVWKSSLEFQVQETDLGDFIPIWGTRGEVRVRFHSANRRWMYDPESTEYRSGYISANPEPDMPHGEWNLLELYTLGTTSVHVVNGLVVMVIENASHKNKGTPISRGQLQIQSEAAECYYKEIKIRPISELPEAILSSIRLRDL